AAIEDDTILAPDGPADAGGLQALHGDADTVSYTRRGPLKVVLLHVALKDRHRRRRAVGVCAAYEDVGHRDAGEAVDLVLDLTEPFLAGGDQIEDDQGDARVAVVHNEAPGVEVVVNAVGGPVDHRAAQRHAEGGRDDSRRGTGEELLLGHGPSSCGLSNVRSYRTTCAEAWRVSVRRVGLGHPLMISWTAPASPNAERGFLFHVQSGCDKSPRPFFPQGTLPDSLSGVRKEWRAMWHARIAVAVVVTTGAALASLGLAQGP